MLESIKNCKAISILNRLFSLLNITFKRLQGNASFE